MRTLLAAMLAASVLAACHPAGPADDYVFRCGGGGACPLPLVCRDGYCLEPRQDAGSDAGEDAGTQPEDDAGTDAGADAGPPPIPSGWNQARLLEGVNTGTNQTGPTVTADQLRVCYASSDPSSLSIDVYCADRQDADGGFGTPVRQLAVATVELDHHPELSPDGAELFLARRTSAYGEEVFVAPRAGAVYGTAIRLADLGNHPGYDVAPSLSGDGGVLFFQSDRRGGSGPDVYLSPRTTTGWSSPERHLAASPDGETSSETEPAISPDGRYLLFTSNRDAGTLNGGSVFWRSVLTDAGWQPAEPMTIQDFPHPIDGLELAPDDSLYFHSKAGGGDNDLYVASPVRPR